MYYIYNYTEYLKEELINKIVFELPLNLHSLHSPCYS